MKKLILILSVCFLTISCSNPLKKDEIMGTYKAYSSDLSMFRPGPKDYLITVTQKDSNTYKFAFSDNWKRSDKIVIKVDDTYIDMASIKEFGLKEVPVIHRYKNDTIYANSHTRGHERTLSKWIKQ